VAAASWHDRGHQLHQRIRARFLVDGYRVRHYTSGDYITEAFAAMPLPNFLIVGAPKCATTSLYRYLRQHPDVYMNVRKEPRYFPASAYRRKSASCTIERNTNSFSTAQRPSVLSSPNYLHAPEGLRGSRPNCSRALRRDVRQEPCQGPFDDFVRDTAAALRDLCAFLDIAPNAAIDTHARRNVGLMPKWAAVDTIVVHAATAARPATGRDARNRPRDALAASVVATTAAAAGRTARSLLHAFEPDIRRTGKMIGRDLSGWFA
jgi:hypothetical protein